MLARMVVVPLVLLVAVGCTKTVVLTEQDPVLLTARAPAPPPPPPPPEPPRVEVQKEKIQVNEKIFFEYKKAVIKPESFDLLNEIARVINQHNEIKKIRIEGHTDNVGNRPYNLDLSKRRAKAVREYLVTKGKVVAARLEMNGYAFDKPIDSNDTDAGRAKNRRVEFMILERDEAAAGDPKAAPAPAAEAKATKGGTK